MHRFLFLSKITTLRHVSIQSQPTPTRHTNASAHYFPANCCLTWKFLYYEMCIFYLFVSFAKLFVFTFHHVGADNNFSLRLARKTCFRPPPQSFSHSLSLSFVRAIFSFCFFSWTLFAQTHKHFLWIRLWIYSTNSCLASIVFIYSINISIIFCLSTERRCKCYVYHRHRINCGGSTLTHTLNSYNTSHTWQGAILWMLNILNYHHTWRGVL